ncbi:hypothetical protein OHA77_22050 [Streptosporangium sp. NBC_01639]|uniref:WXG100 family type VII secretion target n=1 Tax=Streptosporangium sp. NBC_01639 TaxID=2975948 RepID=UPI003870CC15|nr:hypothetical protein OHA77_22050 [Streptosporangium sp. NBC_01639]
MEPEPTPEQWYAWGNSPELSRSWPSPHADIDVNTAGLRKVGDAIMLEVEGAHPYEQVGNRSLLDYWEELDGIFLNQETRVPWGALSTFTMAVMRYSLYGFPETGGISKFVRAEILDTLESYSNFGNMIFATSANYAMADSVFDENISELRYAINGAGVRHETWEKKDIFQQEDNISDYDAPTIKNMLDSVDVKTMRDMSGVCTDLAAWLANLQSLVEQHAKQLAGVWQGEPAELALDAFRKVHATARVLAHSIGTTGNTIAWLAGVIDQYRLDFESVVKMGDRGIDDDLQDRLLPWESGAHDRARDYLRELNQQLKIAFDMLPAEIEIILPDVSVSDAKYAYKKDGLKDGSDYWDSMILRTGHPHSGSDPAS